MSTARLSELTVVFEYYEAKETYSRIFQVEDFVSELLPNPNNLTLFCLLKWSFTKTSNPGSTLNPILSSIIATIVRHVSTASSTLKTSVVSDIFLKAGGDSFAEWYQDRFFTG